MKKVFLLLVISTLLAASNIDRFAKEMGYHRDFSTALQQGKRENKLIMLVVVADYCPWCRKLERKTLKAEPVARQVDDHFIPVIVDRNYDKANYPKQYDVPRIPTVFFIDPNTEDHLYESIAYVKRGEYLNTLNEVQKTFKGKQ